MKYFEIQDTSELKYAPQLKNWYGKFDVRNINIESFPQLPQRQLFIIEPSEKTVFTDIILFPFLLVSPKVLQVIKMYRECCFYRDIILLDQLSGESRIYYLPVFDEINSIQFLRKQYKNGEPISDNDIQKVKGKEIYMDRNFFWVRDSQKRHIMLSMNAAESLIRRGVTGLGLCEVVLYGKD